MAVPQKCISVQEAKGLYTNWHNTRATALSSLGNSNTSDFTFSLAELQEFLDYVKQESNDQGITNPGVRIYFAAYNSLTSTASTVFLAPTVGPGISDNNNYDIQPLNTVGGGWPPNVY